TTLAVGGFKFLFYDLPLSLLVFLAWSVGESVARERWGERLASFDAVLRRDAFNATVGGSLLAGLLAAPAGGAAPRLPPPLPLRSGVVTARLASGTREALNAIAGPLEVSLSCALDALLFSCVGLLFLLSYFHRRRFVVVGAILAGLFGVLMGI